MSYNSLIESVKTLFSNRKTTKTLEDYEAQLEIDPTRSRLWLRHAELCQKVGKVHLALSSYRTAARLMFDRGQLGQAQAAVRMALRLSPGDDFLLAELNSLSRLPRRTPITPMQLPELPAAQSEEMEIEPTWLNVTDRTFSFRNDFLPDTLVDHKSPAAE